MTLKKWDVLAQYTVIYRAGSVEAASRDEAQAAADQLLAGLDTFPSKGEDPYNLPELDRSAGVDVEEAT